MPDNPFDELLREFQEAERLEGCNEFFLVVATEEDWEAARSEAGFVLDPLGRIHLGDKSGHAGPGYCVLAPIVPFECRKPRLHESRTGPFEFFQKLAAKAGEFLPHSVTYKWPARPDNPADVWLTFLWLEKRAPELRIRSLDVRGLEYVGSWQRPFRTSADAIVQRGLSAGRGQLPEGDVVPLRVGQDTFNETETEILAALGSRRMTGEELATALRRKCDSNLKAHLAGLVRRGILVNLHDQDGRGYERADRQPDHGHDQSHD